jgi:SAM-dependent methyltransferase
VAEQPAPQQDFVLEQLRADAAAMRPLLTSTLARSFLDASSTLPPPTARTVLRNKAKTAAYTPEEAAKLSDEKQAALTPRAFDPVFFYYTGYGSPLIYARALDVLAGAGVSTLAGKKILDFGCGTIGHLRVMAASGADAHGIDVEPTFRALYAAPGDQGPVPGFQGAPDGRVTMHIGRWPLERDIVTSVGGGYDIITSKNTLKRGYIHPARTTNPAFLVRLGTDDGTFLRQVHAALKPGGLFLIYNISPAQNPADKPYLPHADGQCPFTREQLKAEGFEVIEFDHEDRDKVVQIWQALGINEGKPAEETRKDLFAWYTLCRKPFAKRL